MTLNRFRARFNAARRAVDSEGRLTTEFSKLIDDFIRSFDTNSNIANTDISTAQTSADNAGAFWVITPSSQGWNTDPTTGASEAGDPSQDILFTLRDKDNTQNLATRTLRGSLDSPSGLITVSEVGTPTGLTTSVTYDPVTNNDTTVKASVTATFADSSESVGVASWSNVDVSVAGGTPGSGLGK